MIKKRKHREWLKSSGPEKTKFWQSEKTVGTAIETRRLYTVFCTTEVTRREWLRLWCTTEVSRREWSAVCCCVLSCTTVYYCILLCTTRTVYCNIRLRSAVNSLQRPMLYTSFLSLLYWDLQIRGREGWSPAPGHKPGMIKNAAMSFSVCSCVYYCVL